MSLPSSTACRIAMLLLITAAVNAARAEIYECVDQNGNKRFTNIAAEAKGCKVLNVGPANRAPVSTVAPTVPPKLHQKGAATPAPIATPANFPRVDRETQRARDNDRRRILEQELGIEQKLLTDAKRDLAEQESLRFGNERNYQRVLDRLEPYKKRVKLHEDNIASLRRELANMR